MREGNISFYFVLPPEHVKAYRGLLRVFVTSVMTQIVKGGVQEKHKIHMVLNEASALSGLDSIEEALDRYRAYGIRIQLYFQFLAQAQKLFANGQHHTVLANMTNIFFGVQDWPTAEYISNKLGEQTIVVNSGGSGTSTSHQGSDGQRPGSTTRSSNRSVNWNLMGRKLLRPEEVISLPPTAAITFTPGIPPIVSILIPYFQRSELLSLKTFRQGLQCLAISIATAVAGVLSLYQMYPAMSGLYGRVMSPRERIQNVRAERTHRSQPTTGKKQPVRKLLVRPGQNRRTNGYPRRL